MIRDATPEDMPALLRMAHNFGRVAELPAPICKETMGTTFRNLMEADGGILLTNDEGTCAAGGLVHPSFFNAAHVSGQELFWWVDPDARGVGMALFDALEHAAWERGAQSWSMGARAALRPEAVGRIYERRGYQASESTYIKIF